MCVPLPLSCSGHYSIPQGADSGPSGPLVECHSCGRSFNQQALQKHAKICAKVFVQKRKVRPGR